MSYARKVVDSSYIVMSDLVSGGYNSRMDRKKRIWLIFILCIYNYELIFLHIQLPLSALRKLRTPLAKVMVHCQFVWKSYLEVQLLNWNATLWPHSTTDGTAGNGQ